MVAIIINVILMAVVKTVIKAMLMIITRTLIVEERASAIMVLHLVVLEIVLVTVSVTE